MKLRILYHGNCFDGVSSAAIFTKFYRSVIEPNAEVAYTPTMHRAGNAFDREQFDGDENAIVDFKSDRAMHAARYREQLALYAQALSAARGKPVTHCWLYWLRFAKAEEV